MKKIFKMKRLFIASQILMIGILLIITQPSCTKLDETVYSELTADKFFSDTNNLVFAFGTLTFMT